MRFAIDADVKELQYNVKKLVNYEEFYAHETDYKHTKKRIEEVAHEFVNVKLVTNVISEKIKAIEKKLSEELKIRDAKINTLRQDSESLVKTQGEVENKKFEIIDKTLI